MGQRFLGRSAYSPPIRHGGQCQGNAPTPALHALRHWKMAAIFRAWAIRSGDRCISRVAAGALPIRAAAFVELLLGCMPKLLETLENFVKIRLKILFGYLFLATLVLLIGLFGYRSTKEVGDKFDAAINQTQPVLQSLQDIRFAAVLLFSEAGKLAPASEVSPASGVKRFGQLDEALGRYRDLVARYFPDEMDEAAEIAEKVEALETLLRTQSADEAAEALTELLEATEEAAAVELKEFVELQHGVKEEVRTQELQIAGLATLAFFITLGGGSLLASRIARPVAQLRDAVGRLGGGRLDARVSVDDRTEVGELAAAFNAMAEQLERSMVSREYVEDIVDSLAEGVIVVDDRGQIMRVNPAFRALYRGPADMAFAGRPVRDFLPNHVPVNMLQEDVSQRWVEATMKTADGQECIVAMSSARLHARGATNSMVWLVRDITAKKRDEERLNFLARFDALTGLPNRTLLLDHLGQALARQLWKTTHTALLFCDLDRFKFVNDSLGHAIGDSLLQRVGERLRTCVRPGDVVARWSGDEFVILLNDIAHSDDVTIVAEKVVALLDRPIQVGPHEVYVTVSVGISLAPEHATLPDELVKCADMAMYVAKGDGKNTFRIYSLGMAERSRERLALENMLRAALQQGGQLQVHYQPQQRIDGPLIGFEALVRWQHPELGLISPGSFLPAAEEAGLLASVDEVVLRLACAQARQWLDQGITSLCIAVNVSDPMFRRHDLLVLLASLLDDFALPPAAIEVELTEAIVMADVEHSLRVMHGLREIGIKLSVDDFGTGYSSLAHLKRCPIQMLKIDRSFIDEVITDPNDAAITEAITALAHKLGIEVIAEGVETDEQLAALRAIGCDAMQGYLLSRPLPAEALPEFIRRFGFA